MMSVANGQAAVPADRDRAAAPAASSSSLTTSRGTDDTQIIQAVLSGDSRAFEQLVKSYGVRMMGLLCQMLGNEADAQDLAQETFIRAYRKLSRFRQESSFGTWLTRIAINLAKNHLSKRRNQTMALPQMAAHSFVDPDTPPDHVSRKEMTDHLTSALEQLSSNHRTVLVLRLLQGMSYKEISQVLNCPIGTVMSRLSHGKKALLRKLSSMNVDLEEVRS